MEYSNTKAIGAIVLPCGTIVPPGETVTADDATKNAVVASWIADGILKVSDQKVKPAKGEADKGGDDKKAQK